MPTAHDILRYKGTNVHSVRPDDTVLKALGVMAEHDVGAVLVLDGNALVGILSERDYARKVALVGRSSRDSPVSAIMTREVVTVGPAHVVPACMQIVTRNRIRHLPVVERGEVVGMISIGDLVAAVIEDQQHELDQLQRYIAG